MTITQDKLKEILHYNPLTGVFVWKISPAIGTRLGSVAGTLHKHGYTLIGINYRRYKASRLAWLYMKGVWPRHQIDHKNLKKNDDRFDNLREATHSSNKANTKVRSDNILKIKCVQKRSNGRYRARILIDGRRVCLGTFETAEQASYAYKRKAVEVFGEFARR